MFNQRTKFIGDSVNVVFDDSVGFYQARVTRKIECVTQPASSFSEVKIKDESEGEDDQTREHHVDLDKAKLHRNHSVADVIGGVFDERVTRKKEIDF